jgi:hypothetical protein
MSKEGAERRRGIAEIRAGAKSTIGGPSDCKYDSTPGSLEAHIPPPKAPPRAQLQYAEGGSLAKLSFHKRKGDNRLPNLLPEDSEGSEGNDGSRQGTKKGGGRRGEVTGFSDSSRLRFSRETASINFDACRGKVFFLTLTYPRGQSPTDPQVRKTQLEKLHKRLDRRYGKVPGFWRLEFTHDHSGITPHYHLILFLEEKLSNKSLTECRNFVAECWYEVCGKISNDHLAAGTQLKRITSRRDWVRLSKYIAKKEKVQGQSLPPERRWGKWHKDLLPVTWQTVELPREEAMATRRVLRKQSGTNRAKGKLLTQKVFIRDTSMRRYVEFLDLDRE